MHIIYINAHRKKTIDILYLKIDFPKKIVIDVDFSLSNQFFSRNINFHSDIWIRFGVSKNPILSTHTKNVKKFRSVFVWVLFLLSLSWHNQKLVLPSLVSGTQISCMQTRIAIANKNYSNSRSKKRCLCQWNFSTGNWMDMKSAYHKSALNPLINFELISLMASNWNKTMINDWRFHLQFYFFFLFYISLSLSFSSGIYV